MKQGKLTLYLLIFCLVSGGIYFLLRQYVKPPAAAARTKARLFDGFSAEQVKRLEIRGSDRLIEIAREDGRWTILKPLRQRADKGEVENLLYAAEYLEQRRRITPDEMAESKTTRADYGLEKPRLSLALAADKRNIRIDIGHEARQGDGVYIGIADDKNVYLVGKSLAEKLEAPFEQWRNRQVFDLEEARVSRIEIKSPKRAIEFARQGDSWRIVQPLNVRASSRAVDSLVEALVRLKAERFLSDEISDAKKFGLEEPRYQATVRTDKSGDAGQTLLLGAPVPDSLDGKQWSAMLKGQSSILAVPGQLALVLDADLRDFRDEQLLHVDKRDIEGFDVVQGGRKIHVEKTAEGWKITEPRAAAADADAVDELLAKLCGMRIQEFVTDVMTELDKYGLGEKSGSIRLLGKKGDKGEAPALAVVRLGGKNPKKQVQYVRREDESSVYAVLLDDLKTIPSGALDLSDRTVLALPREAIQELRLRAGKAECAARKTEKGEWASDETLDRPVLERVLQNLTRLRAARLLSEKEGVSLDRYWLDKPRGTLMVSEKSGNEVIVHELVIGAAGDGRTCLYYKNKDLLAEIPATLADELTRPFTAK